MARIAKAPPKLIAGRHRVRLRCVGEESHHRHGPGYRWYFCDEMGRESVIPTGVKWSPGASLDRLLKQLLGEESPTGTEIDPQDYVGRMFDATVDADGWIVVFQPAAE